MKHITAYTDQELFALIARRDEIAFREIFDRYQYDLYGTAIQLTKSPLQAEEITQEVFISLWVSRLKLPLVENPDAYIFKVLYNKINEYLRKASNREKILKEAISYRSQNNGVNTTEDTINLHESENLVEQALNRLPTQQKTAYRYVRQQGLTIEQAAAQMNLSPHTVKSHLAKALAFIRAYLKDVATVMALLQGFKDTGSF